MPDKQWFGSQPFSSPINSNTGVASKVPCWLVDLHAKNIANATYYVLFYDQLTLPPANIAATDPALIKPIYSVEVEPAIITLKGKGDRNEQQLLEVPQFKKGMSYVCSTDPNRFVSISGQYPITVSGRVSYGKASGFNPLKHGINVGQEGHPAKPAITIDGVDYAAIKDGEFDLRPGGDLEKACDRWTKEGRKLLRLNYDPYDYSKLANWKLAALYMQSRGFEVLLGWTAISTGNTDKTRFDAFCAAIPALVMWAADNGFKTIGLANEEGNHANRTATYTMTYIVAQLFALSVTCRSQLDAAGHQDVKLSFSFSQGERPEVAKQFQAGVAHAFNEFGLNQYGTVSEFANNFADAYAVFGDKLVITEWGDTVFINGSVKAGIFATGSEAEQAISYVQKRNIMDAYGVKSYLFCDVDHGVGANIVDQWGVRTVAGHNLMAHDALLEL